MSRTDPTQEERDLWAVRGRENLAELNEKLDELDEIVRGYMADAVVEGSAEGWANNPVILEPTLHLHTLIAMKVIAEAVVEDLELRAEPLDEDDPRAKGS